MEKNVWGNVRAPSYKSPSNAPSSLPPLVNGRISTKIRSW